MKREGFAGLLYRIFRKDIGRKAMALLCALILWVYLDSLVDINKEYSCPILVVTDPDLINSANQNAFFFIIPEELMEMKTRFDNLKVFISGPKELVPENILIGKKEIYESDMGEDLTRKKTIPFTVEQFPKLKDKENLDVRFEPDQIELDLALVRDDEIVLTEENIEEFRGREELRNSGRLINEVLFVPSNLKIRGPAPEIEKIQENNAYLKLEGIKLEGALSTFINVFIGLSKEMRDKRISSIDDKQVEVTVRFSEERSDYLLEGMDVTVKYRGEVLSDEDRKKIELDSGLEDPEKVNVRINGPSYEITELKKIPREVIKSKLSFYINLGTEPGNPETLSFEEYIKSTFSRDAYTITIKADWPDFDTVILRILPEPGLINVKYIEPQNPK